MSIQTDIETLYIAALENFLGSSNMPYAQAVQMFQDHFVWENMLSQHEYLHQISKEEAMEYVEELIDENRRELVLFHGTSFLFDEIDLLKSHDRRDFGKGFYTTVLEHQAQNWARKMSRRRHTTERYVYVYTLRDTDALSIRRFDSISEEWLEFVKDNRMNGGLQHDFDVVIGPVADDNTLQTVMLYVNGNIDAETALKRLEHTDVNNQVSFHTQQALSCLHLIERIQL